MTINTRTANERREGAAENDRRARLGDMDDVIWLIATGIERTVY